MDLEVNQKRERERERGEAERELQWGIVVEDELVGADGVQRCCAVPWRSSVQRSDDWRRWWRRRFPSLTAPPDRWVGRWGEWDSPVTVPRGPHLPYMVLRDGGPQPQWVGSPDQGADSRAQLAHPLGQLVEINTNKC
jgi:hypothetical protein